MSTTTSVTQAPASFFEFTAPHGEKISPEIAEHILRFCDLKRIPAMAGVNRAWRNATNQDSLWVKLQKRDFPQEVYDQHHPEIGPQETPRAVYQRMHEEKKDLQTKYNKFLNPSLVRDLGGVFAIEHNIPNYTAVRLLNGPFNPMNLQSETDLQTELLPLLTDQTGLPSILIAQNVHQYALFPDAPISKQVGADHMWLFVKVDSFCIGVDDETDDEADDEASEGINTRHPVILPIFFPPRAISSTLSPDNCSNICATIGFIPHSEDLTAIIAQGADQGVVSLPLRFGPSTERLTVNWLITNRPSITSEIQLAIQDKRTSEYA